MGRMNELELIKPPKDPPPPENIPTEEKHKESPSPADKIYDRIKLINSFIKDKPFTYRKIFEEYNIFTIQEKIAQLEEMIADNQSPSLVEDSHFYHTLGNFYAGMGALERVKDEKASQELQASSQKNTIEISLYLDKMLNDKDFFREATETQEGYEKTLH